MFSSITSIFKQLLEGEDLAKSSEVSVDLAIAALLCQVALADQQVDEDEKKAKVQLLTHLLDIDTDKAKSLLDKAEQTAEQAISLYEFTTQLRELDHEKRYELVQAMWQVANADGVIDPLEDAVIRQVAELLYVDHSEFIRAKLSVIDG
ncbi:tellurite resistance TerB family protein [Vibrio sp. SCSIO 43137]|uniref:tellurite resistance TerB family protein n=1 Tax=Vibrio sp. SCSIO 43137 TaxID=3021011 RepID=UPI002306E27A|nr:TerB family tellurite resistance protein [Vibrio sp. SCSIO 43137]WCE28321.1 TerB family tellurite resistance protein [Vibrio sp. SCSIO 43137]